jgi:hypothetical protein
MADYTKAELQEVTDVWDDILLDFDQKKKRHYLGLTVPHDAAPRVMLTVRRIVGTVLKADGREIEWCKVHDSKAATPLVDVGQVRVGMCQRYSLLPSEGLERCVFKSKLLIDLSGDTQ